MKVPVYQPQVNQGGLPSFRQSNPSSGARDFLNPVGAVATEAVTNLAGNVERDMLHLVAREREQADEDRVHESFNKLRERQIDLTMGPDKGFMTQRGRNVIERQSGKTLRNEYMEEFDKSINELSGSLSGDNQKRLFSEFAQRSRTEFYEGLSRHESAQIADYRNSIHDGILAVESQNALKNWNNPDAIKTSISRSVYAIGRKREMNGLSADETDLLMQKHVGAIHANVVANALEAGSIDYADDYLKNNAGSMQADDMLKLNGLIGKQKDAQWARYTSAEIIGGMQQKAYPSDMDKLIDVVKTIESGGVHEQDGALLTSNKGARGAYQIMPATAKDPGFGVTPLQNDSEAEHRRFANDYLTAMIKEFKGDVPKALAAYNGGVETINDAVAAAEKEGDHWIDHVPNETRDYVAKASKLFDAGGVSVKKPTRSEMLAMIDERSQNATPDQRDLLLKETERQWAYWEKDRKGQEDDAVSEAFKMLTQNGGDLTALPASLRARVPGDKEPSLRTYAEQLSKGEPIQTDWNVYYQLSSDDKLLKETNLLAIKDKLSDGDFKHLTEHQNKLKQGGDSELTQVANARQTLNNYLLQAGIDTTPKPGSENAAKIARATSEQQRVISAEEKRLSRKLAPEEIDKLTARLFEPVNFRDGFKFFGGGEDIQQKQLFELSDSDAVPNEEALKIVSVLSSLKIPITDQAIVQMYKQAQFRKTQ
jgi:soluble lytic murein transglycosylase